MAANTTNLSEKAKSGVLCIGNAIVDIIARVDDAFLAKHDRIKGSMMLVDADTSASIYADMPPAVEHSGGSAGNTAAGIASFGGDVAYIGKVHDDQLGAVFTHDIRAIGVSFDTKPLTEGLPTATSMILVTPDAERTMSTFLGACGQLTVDDIDEATVAGAEVTYFEGYMWDTDNQKAAILKAMDYAHASGGLVSISLSDSFCVDRFRAEFLELIRDRVDILFANEDEIKSLYEVDSFDEALELLRPHVKVGALTRSAKGSVVVAGNETIVVEAEAADVFDTTGAGDMYAAGFLYGYTNGRSLENCGKLGSLAAAEVISHLGARPEVSLHSLAIEKSL
ncbi:adenosine kinase [Kordiimonas sp. SCSIO 12610]|uniref:adenosine kinase n=1 Tax=Kordiimonas sp. SCSIO 12610 TaxID=2829597 RepID=UPI00210D9F3C|nr:adenosine kinase [Kordiimonas sp. SCSIO 12610]UTW55572.1 adenosine kinase [Kordiimonas sp. SCSIO 12610]